MSTTTKAQKEFNGLDWIQFLYTEELPEAPELPEVPELPEAPEDWLGPYKFMWHSTLAKDNDGNSIRKVFKSFEDAVEKANEIGENCKGITKTRSGYSLRAGKTGIKRTTEHFHLGLACWTKKLTAIDVLQDTIMSIQTKVISEIKDAACEFWIEWNYMVDKPGYEHREEWLDL